MTLALPHGIAAVAKVEDINRYAAKVALAGRCCMCVRSLFHGRVGVSYHARVTQ